MSDIYCFANSGNYNNSRSYSDRSITHSIGGYITDITDWLTISYRQHRVHYCLLVCTKDHLLIILTTRIMAIRLCL